MSTANIQGIHAQTPGVERAHQNRPQQMDTDQRQYTTISERAQDQKMKEAQEAAEDREAQRNIEKELKKTFRPEFINRIDEIITFSPLSIDDMIEIVDLQLTEVSDRLLDHGIQVDLTPAARQWLAEVGYDPDFGARPLKRALQKHVESPLSLKLLSGDFKDNAAIQVDVDEDGQSLVFKHRKKADEPAISDAETIEA